MTFCSVILWILYHNLLCIYYRFFLCGNHEAHINITSYFKLITTSEAYRNFILPHISLSRFRLLMLQFPYFYIQFSSVTQLWSTLCDPMNCSTPGLPVHHQLLEFTQTHVHRVGDAIQPSHPLSSPSPPAPNPCQHQGLFQWVNSSHEVAKVLEFQL